MWHKTFSFNGKLKPVLFLPSTRTKFCKSRVPADLIKKLDAVKDDKKAVEAVGIAHGAQMCRELMAADINNPGLHFYCLNLAAVTNGILKDLELWKEPPAEGVLGEAAQ